MHIGEAEVAALEAPGELFVVEAELVEQGGMKVVDVDPAFGDAEAEFIGGAVEVAGTEPPAGDPHREGIDVVVAADGGAHFLRSSTSAALA